MSPPSPVAASLGRSSRGRGAWGAGVPGVAGAKPLALASLSAANNYRTNLATGGEAGVSTGFGILSAFIPLTLTPPNAQMLSCKSGAVGSSLGYQLYLSTTGAVTAVAASSAPAYVTAPTRQLVPGDLGRVHVALLYHDGTKLRLWLDRHQAGDGMAISGYSAGALAHAIGVHSDGATYPASNCWILDTASFRGTATDAQIAALMDTFRTSARFQSAAGVSLTHRWPLAEGLSGTTVVDGQTAPASIADGVTAAAADAMMRNASPTVKAIDSAIDGRKSYGVGGFGPGANLQTANGAGIRGSASGFTIAIAVQFNTASAGAGNFASCCNASVTQGWNFYRHSNSTVYIYTGNGSATFVSKILGAGDIGVPCLLHLVNNGSTTEGFFNGVSIGTVACVLVPAAASIPMTVGDNPASSVPAASETVYGIAGGNVVLTAAEVAAQYADWQRTMRMPTTAGKPFTRVYDFSLDIAAAPAAGVPAQILDRAGTDHLTRFGTMDVNAGGLRCFQSQHPRSATVAAGLPGAAAGWWAEGVVRIVQSGTNQTWFSNTGGGANGLDVHTAGGTTQIRARFGDGTNTYTLTSGAQTAGALVHWATRYTGSVGELYINGALVATSAAFTYAPGTQPTKLGQLDTSPSTVWGIDQSTHYGCAGGNFVPTAGEIAAAASAGATNSKPMGITAKTDRRWSIPDDIAAAGGSVPGVLAERVSGANPLVMVGSGLQVSRRTERLWSFETTPVMRGGRNWSVNNYLQASSGAGLFTQVLPYWFALAIIVHQKAGNQYEMLMARSRSDGFLGVNAYGALTYGQLQWTHGLGSSNAPLTYTLPDAELGKPILFGGQWTGSVVQGFVKRGRFGADVAATTFAPFTTTPLRLGRHADSTSWPASDNVTILGVMGGYGNLSTAEWQCNVYDAFASEEKLVAVPGPRTARLWNVFPGASTAAVTDEMGSGELLALNGAPTVSNIYTRAMAA